jgi:two-component system sensor histidine kinase DesK
VPRMLQVQQTAQESMRELRDVVSGYRSVDLDGELGGARALLRAAGIRTRVIGDGSGLPTSIQAALGWVVREATTNVIRHSAPDTVTIEVSHEAIAHPPSRVAVLRIDNDGAFPADPSGPPQGGSGLLGLSERIAALGGQLTAEPSTGGRFRIESRIPLAVAEPAIAIARQSR